MNVIIIAVIVGFKIFNVLCTLVVYITYNMGNWDLPHIYPLALGPAALGLRDIAISDKSLLPML